MAARFERLVDFVEEHVAQQRRERTTLRCSFLAVNDHSVHHHSRLEETTDNPQHPLVLDSLGKPPHQEVVIDSIEESFEVNIDNPVEALLDVALRLEYSLVRATPRSKTVTVSGETCVESRTKHLQDGLLDESIDYRRDAELALTSVGFCDRDAPHWARLVDACEQLCAQGLDVSLQITG